MLNDSGMAEDFIGAELVASGNESDSVYCEVLEEMIPLKDCTALSQAAQVNDGSASLNVPDPMKRGEKTAVYLYVDRRLPELVEELDNMMTTPIPGEDNTTNAIDPIEVPNDDGSLGNSASTGVDDPAPKGKAPDISAKATGPPNPTPKQQTDKLAGTSDTFRLKVGRRMRADLRGQGFSIARKSPAVVEIPREGQGSWIWEVTALQGGSKSLAVTTVVEAAVNGKVYKLQKTEHLRVVTVGVPFWTRVREWLAGLPGWIQLLTAIVSALGALAVAWYSLKRSARGGGTPGST